MPAPVDIPFPLSSMPGQRPGEGQGRLINCFCEIDGNVPTWRNAPGMALFATTDGSGPRGSIVKGNLLFVAMQDTAFLISGSGSVSRISGTIDGSNPVTWAQNNRSPADLLVVTENDVFAVSSTSAIPLGQANLPKPNSVSMLDGFFLFTIGDGRVFASDLNSTNVNALSFTTCQSDPDGLLRGVTFGSQFFACGPASIEVYADAGTSPFPLSRQAVIPVGLAGPWAVAGFGTGWDQAPYFVAADGTVRQLQGYTAPVVSTKDVDRAIQAIADKTTLRASVHAVAGHPTVTISSPSWTWEYNVSTQKWHERKSEGLSRWRGETSIRFNNKWIVGDTLSGSLYELSEAAQDEAGQPLAMVLESGPVKQFPSRLKPYTGWFDWSTGQGLTNGSDDVVSPTVEVGISKDGGGTWNVAAVRSVGKQGEFGRPIRVNRIAGTTSQHGLRIRNVCSSPIPRSFRGGRLTVDQRLPA